MGELSSQTCNAELVSAAIRSSLHAARKSVQVSPLASSSGEGDVDLLTYRDGIRVTLAARNNGSYAVTLLVDSGGSTNAETSASEQGVFLTLEAGETRIAHHLVPANVAEKWHIKCTPTLTTNK